MHNVGGPTRMCLWQTHKGGETFHSCEMAATLFCQTVGAARTVNFVDDSGGGEGGGCGPAL